MSAEEKDDELNPAGPSNQDDKKEAGNKKSKAAGKKKKDASDRLQLPVLVEFAFSFSLIILLLADLLIMVTSFLSGADLLDIVIRTVVTTIVLGVLLWLLTGILSKGAIEAAYSSIYTEEKKSSPNAMDLEEKHIVEA